LVRDQNKKNTVLTVILSEPVGKSKISYFTVGIRKRTNGPDTGYLAISAESESGRLPLDKGSCAIAYWDDPAEWLRKLYDKEIKKYM
jgi:hypothetical protein